EEILGIENMNDFLFDYIKMKNQKFIKEDETYKAYKFLSNQEQYRNSYGSSDKLKLVNDLYKNAQLYQ
ncbi:hypothetical protein IKS57_03320, partial [bacterium]|nr:hypothetical protein [bacterium]